MKINQSEFKRASLDVGLSESTATALWAKLEEKIADTPRFNLVHVLYYFGALLAILAMSFFINQAWDTFGSLGLLIVSTSYMVGFFVIALSLKPSPEKRIPIGLFATLGVATVPLVIFALQKWGGFFEDGRTLSYHDFHVWIRSQWFYMEIITIIVGLFAVRYFKFPFIVMPIAFTLWYLSMDIAPIIADSLGYGLNKINPDQFNSSEWNESITSLFHLRKLTSLFFGLAMIALAYRIDFRTRQDYAFWLYLFGTVTFWGGLTLLDSGSELGKFFYFLVNLLLIGLSVFLNRRIFVVCGAIGTFSYLSHLAFKVFEDSILFMPMLLLMGVSIIWFASIVHKNGKKWEAAFIKVMPSWMQKIRPLHRIDL